MSTLVFLRLARRHRPDARSRNTENFFLTTILPQSSTQPQPWRDAAYALNAAVEAARAGQQGRGFAVVAAEVGTLAQRSASAAREIKTLIDASVRQVNDGGQQVNATGRTMQEVVTAVQQVAELIGQISRASAEQSTGIEGVNRAITQSDHATQQNATLVDNAAKLAASLQQQVTSLVASVAHFRLGAAEFGHADDAAAMVKQGIAFLRTAGRRQMLAAVNQASAQFRDRDLYLSIYDIDSGTVVAHATTPRLLGANIAEIRDIDGRFFIRDMVVASTGNQSSGWIDYKWQHPISQATLVKSAYFERAGSLILACGCYKQQAPAPAAIGPAPRTARPALAFI